MSESLFLLSSAITTKHGVYHRSTRINQTKETILSVQKYSPNSDMVILDGGQRDLEDFEKQMFRVLEFKSFADHDIVKQVHKVQSHDIVKNLIEIYMYREQFKFMLDNEWDKKYKRFFKLSGRYTLNDYFSYDNHMKSENKVCFLNSRPSQFPPELTGNAKVQYMSRLWSFDSSLLSYIHTAYCNMYDDMQSRLGAGGYIDIEHLLYKHIDESHIVNFDLMGVSGNIAPNGYPVSE